MKSFPVTVRATTPIVIRLRSSAQQVHARVPCLRRSGFAQAGETHFGVQARNLWTLNETSYVTVTFT